MESLYEIWERYKELLCTCPYHRLLEWLKLQTFYNGLNNATRTLIDVTTKGSLMGKSIEAVLELPEEMLANAY